MFHKKIIFSCPCQAPCKEFDKRIDRMATREPQWGAIKLIAFIQ